MKIFGTDSTQFTHAMLGNFMPWYSGWLDDGNGKPDPGSIMFSSILNCIEMAAGLPERKLYKN